MRTTKGYTPMRLLWLELKKCMTWPILGLVIVLNVLLYSLLVGFHFDYFPNGHPSTEIFNIELEMVEKYGETIEDYELLEMKAAYENSKQEVNDFLKNEPTMQKIGIETLEQYQEALQTNSYSVERLNLGNLDGFKTMWQFNAYSWIMERIEDKRYVFYSDDISSKKELKRIEQLRENDSYQVYGSDIIGNFLAIAKNVTIVMLFTILIVLSPLYLRDRARSVTPLQYSSKRGRKTFLTKWCAGSILASALVIILMGIYSYLYKGNGTQPFFYLQLYRINYNPYWYDFTFAQFITCIVVLMLWICGVFGVFTMICSALSKSYLVLMASQIVQIGLFIWLILPYTIDILFRTNYSEFLVLSILGILTILAVIGMLLIRRYEYKRDITGS